MAVAKRSSVSPSGWAPCQFIGYRSTCSARSLRRSCKPRCTAVAMSPSFGQPAQSTDQLYRSQSAHHDTKRSKAAVGILARGQQIRDPAYSASPQGDAFSNRTPSVGQASVPAAAGRDASPTLASTCFFLRQHIRERARRWDPCPPLRLPRRLLRRGIPVPSAAGWSLPAGCCQNGSAVAWQPPSRHAASAAVRPPAR